MSNTINKRAEEYGKQYARMSTSYEAYAEKEDVIKAYTQGAKEQQQIIIEKTANWLKHGGYFVNNTETLEDFIKAMEKE